MLTLDVAAPPLFATRRFLTAATAACRWRRRRDFTPRRAASASRRVQLVGDAADVAALAALLAAARIGALLHNAVGVQLPPAPADVPVAAEDAADEGMMMMLPVAARRVPAAAAATCRSRRTRSA